MSRYFILAYYHFTPIENPDLEVIKHKEFLMHRDVKARVYLSGQGINGQLSAAYEDAKAYMEWLKGDERFKEMEFKIHTYDEHVFPKLTIKTRKQLVALDVVVDLSKRGESTSPLKWREMLEKRDENTLLLDVRNHYEWEIGHFDGAIVPEVDTFRQFPDFAEKLKKNYDAKNTKVMMYCTGGIRCELYSSLLKEKGFETIYQLQGGIIKYGLEEGDAHWKGKLFVFDDRLVVPLMEGSEIIGKCRHCGSNCDTYYNCANMDCNELFISCLHCALEKKGCCDEKCLHENRVRAFDPMLRAKPFRKLPFEEKKRLQAVNNSN